MRQLNVLRLILAGLASGIIIYIFEGVLNGAILGHEWKLWALVADRVFQMPDEGFSMIMWALQALIAGLAGAFIYAGIRGWIGVNLRAAYVSGLIIWAIGWLAMSMDKLALGVEPHKMIYDNLLAALLGCLAGQVVGSFIYKDKAE